MTPLCDLSIKYGTDKITWGYTPHYYDMWYHRRNSVQRVLEIGICGQRDIPNNVTGASLFMWRDFFPNAQVYGIDIDSKWMVTDAERITTFVGDQTDPDSLRAIASAVGGLFDFIVDDAIHDPQPQLNALSALFPYLVSDGIYAIEDVCPYKCPDNNLDFITDRFPPGSTAEVIRGPKPEVLLLARRV